MTTLHLDFETRSTVDLPKAGIDNYAKSPDTDVWCMSFAFDDEEPRLLTAQDLRAPRLSPQRHIAQHIEAGGICVAHNASFELAIWNHILVPRYGWPVLKPEQVRCTMAMAYAMALPGSLEKAAAAVGITQQKDAAGSRLMMQMARPREMKVEGPLSARIVLADRAAGSIVWWDEPERLERLYEYCKQDVRVERELEKRLMQLSDSEQRLWVLDRKINNRGVYVDTQAVKAAIAVVELEQQRLNEEMRNATGNFVGFCTETARLTEWVRSRGVPVDGIAKADVLDALEIPGLPDDVRQALLLRQEAGKSSTAKLKAMVTAVSSDGRLRDMLQYHGAGTGRWAGRRVQLHNMPRPKIPQDEIEEVLNILAGSKPEDARSIINVFHGSPLDVISSCLRGMLTAAPGHDLMAADFNAIEARVLAWLAGEEKVLDVFRSHGKIYEHAAAGIYRKAMGEVTKDERQIGKVAVLALGYGGGKGAFQVMAKGYGVKVDDERAEQIKVAWREAHQKIVEFWHALEETSLAAVLNPGRTCAASFGPRAIKFRMNGSFLWCRLPSSRVLCFPYPKLKPRTTPWGAEKDQLHYMTVDGLSNKWVETHTYGGKLAENVTQAVARDLLAEAITRAETAGFPVVLHVHDEVVAEVPRNDGKQLHHLEMLCAETPAWAEGLPVTAEGWRGRRYRK